MFYKNIIEIFEPFKLQTCSKLCSNGEILSFLRHFERCLCDVLGLGDRCFQRRYWPKYNFWLLNTTFHTEKTKIPWFTMEFSNKAQFSSVSVCMVCSHKGSGWFAVQWLYTALTWKSRFPWIIRSQTLSDRVSKYKTKSMCFFVYTGFRGLILPE